MNSKVVKKVLFLIQQAGSLLRMPRSHARSLGNTYDTIASHSHHVSIIAYCIARMEKLSHNDAMKALSTRNDDYQTASRALGTLNLACVLSIVGIWIEKGMGLIIPAFVPTPLGEVVEYTPTTHEVLICFGIWALGLLLYTIFVRVSVPVLAGEVTYARRRQLVESRRPGRESASPGA